MIKKIFGNRKRVIITLSLVFLLLVTAGGTFAYLAATTKEETNVFTGSDNIRARLTEPNWEKDEALRLVPGKTVRKDPMITNTGQSDVYVAIQLTFQYEDGMIMSGTDLLRLIKLLDITWSDKWKTCSGSILKDASGNITDITQPLIFYYNEDLSPGEISDPIFSSIRVKDKVTDGTGAITEEDLRWLQGIKIRNGAIVDDPDGLGGFHIQVEGAAIQTISVTDAADAANTLISLFP